MRRTLHVALCFLMILFAALPAAYAETGAADIEEKKAKIKERDKRILQLEKEKKLTLEEKEELMKQLSDMKSRLMTLNEQVYQSEQELKKRSACRVEKRIKAEALLKNRLRFLYQRGDMYYLETLLESDSFMTFVPARSDRKLIRGSSLIPQAGSGAVGSEKLDRTGLEERRKLAAEAERLHSAW